MKNFSIYSLSVFLPLIVSFFLFPVFSNYLTPEDYGIRAIVILAVWVFVIISDFGTNWVIRYKYFRFNDSVKKAKYLFTLIIISLFLKVVISIFMYSVGNLIFATIFKDWTDFYTSLLNIQILVFLFTFTANTITPILILEKCVFKYTLLLLGSFFINTIISMLFLIKYKLGIVSLFYGQLGRELFFTILSLFYLINKVKLGFDWQVVKDITKVGLSALFVRFFEKIQTNVNTYFIAVYLGPADLGLFDKSGFIHKGFMGLHRSFGSSISPDNIKNITRKGEDHETGRLSTLFTYFLSIILVKG